MRCQNHSWSRLALMACLIRTHLIAHLKTLSKVSQAVSELSGSDAAVFFDLIYMN